MDAVQSNFLLFESSVAAVVLADGLDTSLKDALYLVRRPVRFGRAILAVIVIVPLTAVVVTAVLPLSLAAKAGVILMALAPIPPVLPKMSVKLGGQKSYIIGLYVTFSALAVVTVPATVAALNWYFGTQVEVPKAELLKLVLRSVLAPLVAGMLIRWAWPRLAERIAPWVSNLSLLLLVTAVVLILYRYWPVIMAMVGSGMTLGIATISLAAILGGHFLGGPDPRDRVALAATAATRHPAIAMAVAHANSAHKRVEAAIMIYLIVSLVVVAVYQAVLKRAARAEPSGGTT